MVPVRTFPDDHDMGAFVDATVRIWRHEGHGLYILVQVIVQLLQQLVFTALGIQGFDDGCREDMGNLPVVSTEEENGNHDKPHLESPAAAPEEGTVEGASRLHHGPGKAHSAGNDDAQGNDRHHQVHGGPHGPEEILDFLHMGRTDCHHGKHIHFPAEEHVVADVDEGEKHHEEGVNPCNHGPQGAELLQPRREGGVHIGQCKEESPQHVVVAEMLLLRKGRKTVGPGKSTRPEQGQDGRPGKEPLQVGPVHGEGKPEGHDEHHQQRRPQPGLHVAVDIRKIAAQMENCHDHHGDTQGPEQSIKNCLFHKMPQLQIFV